MPLSNITIVTACRDAGGAGVQAFRDRVDVIKWPSANVRACVLEGDSNDDTWERLSDWWQDDPLRLHLYRYDTGEPRYGQHTDPARLAHLARVWNKALAMVDLEWTDYVFLVPFDIQWQPETVTNLWANNVPAVSPLTFCDGVFYDTWAMVHNGKKWAPFTAEFAQDTFQGQLLDMDMVGGTCLFDADVLHAGARFTEDECDHGLYATAKQHGFRLYCDTGCWVQHPREDPKPWSY